MEISFVQGWTREAASAESALLLSPGSMTLDLECLFGSETRADVKSTARKGLSEEEAACLGERAGDDAIERVVWLSVSGKRLVCALTLAPVDRVEGWLLKSLEERSPEPIGRILGSRGIAFSRERLETGVIRCKEVSGDLGIPEDTALLARRFVLLSTRGGTLVMKALVVEIFSPELVRGLETRVFKDDRTGIGKKALRGL